MICRFTEHSSIVRKALTRSSALNNISVTFQQYSINQQNIYLAKQLKTYMNWVKMSENMSCFLNIIQQLPFLFV